MLHFITRFNRYELFGLAVITLLVGVFLAVIIVSSLQSSPEELPILPSPTTVPTLTTRERSYPAAKPQPFYNDNTNQTGTLIVTSSPDAVRVRIDAGEEEVPLETQPYPQQVTPFTITQMPTGKHHLRAAKPGYVIQDITVEVKPNTINRAVIRLQRIQPVR